MKHYPTLPGAIAIDLIAAWHNNGQPVRILPRGTHGRILSARRVTRIWYSAPDYYARAYAQRMDSAARWEAYSSQMAGML